MIDRDTVSVLYDRHGQELFLYICSFVQSSELAEDLLHDTFVRLMDHASSRDLDATHLRAFLYTIARNLCIDHARRRKRIKEAPLDEVPEVRDPGDMDAALMRRELMDRIQGLVAKHDETTRSIYYLKIEGELTYRDVAERLGVSERTAKRKMAALLAHVAEELEKGGFLPLLPVILALICAAYVSLMSGSHEKVEETHRGAGPCGVSHRIGH